jgi:hypothetical protein
VTASADVPAIVAAATLGVGAVLAQWGPALRWRVPPEAALVLALGAAWSVGLQPGAVGSAWSEVLFDRTTFRLVTLAALGALAIQRDPSVGGRTGVAIVGAVLAGSLATAILVVPAAKDAREGARLGLLAAAAGAISPFGGPGPQLLGDATAEYALWALPPALVAAALAWPGADGRPARPTLAGAFVALALVASTIAGLPNLGLQLACVAGLVAMVLPAPEGALDDPGTARTWLPVRQSVVAVALVSLAQLGGSLRYALPGLDPYGGHALAAAAGWGLGLLADPQSVALVARRLLDLGFDRTSDPAFPLALGVALSPGAVLAVATAAHGRAALRHGLPVAVGQGIVAVIWALLA